MAILSGFLLVAFIISAVLLVIIVLMQDEAGEGLGGIFGGGGAAPVGNRSGNVLTKATTVIAVVFFVSVVGYAYVNRTPETSNIEAAARELEGEGEGVFQWWETDEPVELPEGAGDALDTAPAAVESGGDESPAADDE